MFASNLNCDQKSKEDMLSCMQSKSLEEIHSASDLGFSNAPYEGPLIWASVVDGDFVSDPLMLFSFQFLLKNKDVRRTRATSVTSLLNVTTTSGRMAYTDNNFSP